MVAHAYQNILNYLKGSYQELKRVIWPSWQITLQYTLIVIGISLAFALILGVFDFVFGYLLKLLITT